MSKRVNPTLIGGFVLGAVALAVLAVLVLSSGSLFAQHRRFVLVFEGSVKGLEVGAPVTFRGVKIGMVKDIAVLADPDSATFSVPVIIEMEPERLVLERGTLKQAQVKISMEDLVAKGLRAQLQLQSLLTGQLYVQLDFYPDKPARYVSRYKDVAEIPTIPTPVQQLSKKFEDFPVEQVLENVAKTTAALDRVLNSPEIPKALENLNRTLVNLDRTLVSVRNTVGEDSLMSYQLNDTLQEVNKAGRAVRGLADTLERQPEALLKGKRSDNK